MSTSWIPEPPKTPAELEEAAVENELSIRLQAVLVVALLALFWLFAGVYDLDDDFARYGRDNDLSGLFDRIEQESVEGAEALQEHPIVWFVGASIIKQAMDEDVVNQRLAEAGSPWRVRKLGFARGGPVLAAGLLDRLPIKPGDLVVGAVWFSNFRGDWMVDNDSAEALLPYLMSCGEILQLKDILLQDRLEFCLTHPETFFLIRDEWNTGMRQTWNHHALGYRKPRDKVLPTMNRHVHAKRFVKEGGFQGGGPQIDELLALDEDQVNVVGLRRMRERSLEAGAAFAVLQLPMHPGCEAARMAPATLAQWTAYTGLEGIPFTTIPGDWPGSSFWDYQHLNGAGRDAFLEWLLPLLVNDRFPAELPTTWNGASLPPPVGL